ncbi:MAG: Holliday junction resolvase RuvX [Cyanobacteria bacterium REEB65]|nr:Holliday junction resolvase RuvX [Cyanobacteria bacterium REEB65]
MLEARRLLGLDVGERKIGVAVSDPLGITAQGEGVIVRTSNRGDMAAIERLACLYQPEAIVVGYPLSLSGQVHHQAKRIDAFIALLEPLGLPVIRQDERFTTKIAQQVLIQGGVSRSKRREIIDQQAAILILQAYLDRQHRERNSDGTSQSCP